MSARLFALIGFMGAGKTTIGKYLANSMELAFLDLDADIQASTGVSIATIFDIEGEEGFRARETKALRAITLKDDCVVSTGGGIVLKQENRHLLATAFDEVIYLCATDRQLYERLRYDRKRPLMQVEDPMGQIQLLLHSREPIYQSLATITVNTHRKSPRRVAQEIREHIRAREGLLDE